MGNVAPYFCFPQQILGALEAASSISRDSGFCEDGGDVGRW